MAVQEFPLSPEAQRMQITLGTIEYIIRFYWCASLYPGWMIDLYALDETPLAMGVPLTAGEDVLQQLGYLGFDGQIRVATDDNPLVEPTYDNLGTNGRVYFITPEAAA